MARMPLSSSLALLPSLSLTSTRPSPSLSPASPANFGPLPTSFGGSASSGSNGSPSKEFLEATREEANRYSQGGDPHGHDWVPPECDVSIRPGWFWHGSEHPKSAMALLDIYYKSVGRNCLLILNVPPNSSGLISDEDLQVLHDFTAIRSTIFSINLAQNAIVTASNVRGGMNNTHFGPYNVLQQGIYSYWAPEEGETDWTILLDLGQSIAFNVLQVQEPVQMGQRVIKFHVDILRNGGWTTIVCGTTIGYKRLLQFPMVETRFLWFIIDDSRANPLISYIGIHLDPFTIINDLPSAVVHSSCNDTQAIKLSTYKHFGNASIATI